MRERLEGMLRAGQDSALLRYSLGNECLREGDAEGAITHFEVAITNDPEYSAAWKHLGKAQLAAGRRDDAARSWRRGIEVAEARGDVQAGKEMQVFLRRLERDAGD